MSPQIPFAVATQNELGVLTALRQLSSSGTTLSLEDKQVAKDIIVGWYCKQTGMKGNPDFNHAKKEDLFSELEMLAVKGGLASFSDEFIEARLEVGLVPSSVFPLHPSTIPSSLENREEVWNALKFAGDDNDGETILRSYLDAKVRRGKTPPEMSTKLEHIEKRLMDAQNHRWTDAIIRLRSEFFLPPSTILLANLSNVPSTSTANITPTSLSVSFSSDPADNARAAYKFLSRRAVDGYVESQHAVLAALSSSRSRNEKGRVELLLQGFCDHNRRNSRNVEERLDRLEAEMRARKLPDFSAEIYETRFLLSLPPSKIFPFTPPPPPSPLPLAQPPSSNLDSLQPVSRQPEESDTVLPGLPAYERVDPEVRSSREVERVASPTIARSRSRGDAGGGLDTVPPRASTCSLM